jgi:cation diffusion facilitator CzcD-associated flavoprotein CzcO
VLVAGAGEAGLAAGMALRQAALSFMMVDAGDRREVPGLATTTG